MMVQPVKPSYFSPSEVGKLSKGKQQGNNGEKREYQQIINDDPEVLVPTIQSSIIDTVTIAKKINAIMSRVFDDWYGCLISFTNVNGRWQWNVTFTFKAMATPAEDDDRRAFKARAVAQRGSSMIDQIAAYNESNRRDKNFNLTEYASELLYDLLIPNFSKNIDPFNPASYDKLISEQQVNQTFGNGSIYCSISCIDIQKLLSLIYGEKGSDKSKNYYLLTPVRTMAMAAGMQITNSTPWICTLSTMTRKEYEEALQKVGYTPNTGEIPAITATD